MVNHHRKRQAVDTKASRKLLKAILDPSSPMFKRFARNWV